MDRTSFVIICGAFIDTLLYCVHPQAPQSFRPVDDPSMRLAKVKYLEHSETHLTTLNLTLNTKLHYSTHHYTTLTFITQGQTVPELHHAQYQVLWEIPKKLL